MFGTLNGFQEWGGTNWKDYFIGTTANPNNRARLTVTFGSADIMPDGSYTGVATGAPAAGTNGLGNSGAGRFEGKCYGPRTDADLETAGSWHVGAGTGRVGATPRIIVGSFGAKQKAAASSN